VGMRYEDELADEANLSISRWHTVGTQVSKRAKLAVSTIAINDCRSLD